MWVSSVPPGKRRDTLLKSATSAAINADSSLLIITQHLDATCYNLVAASGHEDVWGSGGMAPLFLVQGRNAADESLAARICRFNSKEINGGKYINHWVQTVERAKVIHGSLSLTVRTVQNVCKQYTLLWKSKNYGVCGTKQYIQYICNLLAR
jgi:hypothetical protein